MAESLDNFVRNLTFTKIYAKKPCNAICKQKLAFEGMKNSLHYFEEKSFIQCITTTTTMMALTELKVSNLHSSKKKFSI